MADVQSSEQLRTRLEQNNSEFKNKRWRHLLAGGVGGAVVVGELVTYEQPIFAPLGILAVAVSVGLETRHHMIVKASEHVIKEQLHVEKYGTYLPKFTQPYDKETTVRMMRQDSKRVTDDKDKADIINQIATEIDDSPHSGTIRPLAKAISSLGIEDRYNWRAQLAAEVLEKYYPIDLDAEQNPDRFIADEGFTWDSYLQAYGAWSENREGVEKIWAESP